VRAALLHGFAGDPATWDAVIEAWQLPDPPRAVALPGHGGAPVQETWAASLATLANLDADVVVGYSMGARVALGLVAAGYASRAVLISVNPGITDAERAARRATDAEWAALLRTHGLAAFESRWTAQPLFASQQRVDPARLARRRVHRIAHDPEQLARSLEAMGLAEMPDYRPALPALRGRLALIAGADDAKYVAIARATGLPVEVIPDSGHDPTLEQPERLATAIARAVVRLA
jgi:2-succinyl-6-hydroxy-2,4-cyclohexadiene-1-carboxylate synthase